MRGKIYRNVFHDLKSLLCLFKTPNPPLVSLDEVDGKLFFCPHGEIFQSFGEDDFQSYEALYRVKRWRKELISIQQCLGGNTTRAININHFCLVLDIVRIEDEDFYHIFIPNSEDPDVTIFSGLKIKGRKAWFS